jgi:hypothetical protein
MVDASLAVAGTVVLLRISIEHRMPSDGANEVRRTLIERCQHEVLLGDLQAVLTHTGEGFLKPYLEAVPRAWAFRKGRIFPQHVQG